MPEKVTRSKVCRMLKIPRSTYYYRKKHAKGKGYSEEEAEQIRAVFRQHHGSFGRRMLKKELERKGIRISCKKVSKIMKGEGLVAKYGRKKGKNVHTHPATAGRYVARNIYWELPEEDRPKNVWSMDFTEQVVSGKKYYTCGIISVRDKVLIAKITSRKNNSETAIATVELGISRYGIPDMIMTDRGSPFVSRSFYKLLKEKGITHSMSRPHTPRDNRYIETFWHTMKTEIGVVKTMTEASYLMVFEYYEYYYNNERPHSSLGYKRPLEAKGGVAA